MDENVLNEMKSVSSYKCHARQNIFNTKLALFMHLQGQVIEYPCDTCEKIFFCKNDIESHKFKHLDVVPFKCDFCDQCFKDKGNFDEHKLAHLGKKKYFCKHCRKGFVHKQALVLHMIAHNGQIKCPRFKTISLMQELTRHTGVHSAVKSLHSKTCEKIDCEECKDASSTICPEKNFNNVFKANNSNYEPEISIRSDSLFTPDKIYAIKTDNDEPRKIPKHSVKNKIISHSNREESDKSFQNNVPKTSIDYSSINSTLEDLIDDISFVDSFKCPICQNILKTKLLMLTHLQEHLIEYPCDLCAKVFFCKTDKIRHKFTHSDITTFMCDFCEQCFEDNESFRFHKLTHLGVKKHFCKHCKKGFVHKRALTLHMIIHNGRIKCLYFLKTIPKANMLIRHLGEQSLNSSCEIHEKIDSEDSEKNCFHESNADNLKYKPEISILPEKMLSSDEVRIEETVDDKPNKNLKDLIKQKIGSKGEQSDEIFQSNISESIFDEINSMSSYKCHICQNIFNTNLSMSTHLQEHVIEYPCNLCARIFFCNKEMEMHRFIHLGLSPYVCDVCDETFQNKKYFDVHMSAHLGTKKHFCKQCKMSFVHKQALTLHNNVHNGQYKCPFCQKVFQEARILYSHKSSHDETKKFKCKFCAHCFNRLSKLERHISAVHLNEKKFQCYKCFKSYKTISELKMHLKAHAGKVNICAICKKVYANCSSLQRHICNIHLKKAKNKIERKKIQKILQVTDLELNKFLNTHKEKKYVCEICEKVLTDYRRLQNHLFVIHLNRGKCETVLKSFKEIYKKSDFELNKLINACKGRKSRQQQSYRK